jgi:hypothetical protein
MFSADIFHRIKERRRYQNLCKAFDRNLLWESEALQNRLHELAERMLFDRYRGEITYEDYLYVKYLERLAMERWWRRYRKLNYSGGIRRNTNQPLRWRRHESTKKG